MNYTLINPDNLQKWIDIEIADCPAHIVAKRGKETMATFLTKQVKESLILGLDDAFAQKNCTYCKVDGAVPNDYKYRLYQTDLGEIVTSIRFMGGDLTKCFVSILYKDFPLNKKGDIRYMVDFLKEAYALFKPKDIAWFSTEINHDLISDNDFVRGDMLYFSQYLDYLKQQPKPKNFEKISLKLATSTDWYAQYKMTYEQLYKEIPNFIDMAHFEPETAFPPMIEAGLLYEVFVENELAGIIGVAQNKDRFYEGYVVYEEVFFNTFRRKGLASTMQRHLIEHLTDSGNDMLFGTIHYGNIASQKTALGVGRKMDNISLLAKI